MPRSADDQHGRLLAALNIAAEVTTAGEDKTESRYELDAQVVQTEALASIALELHEVRILIAPRVFAWVDRDADGR